MTDVTDRDVIVLLADIFGTLKGQTARRAYIGPRRMTFDDRGNLILVEERASEHRKWVAVGSNE